MLRLRALGLLTVSRGNDELQLGGPRACVVLAMLTMGAGRPVGRSSLVDALWESEPPASAVSQVAVHISRLRKILGKEIVETVGGSYRLRTEAVDLDLDLADRLIRQGRENQHPDALREALSLWRGPVLEGIESAALQPSIRRWEDTRLAALEDLARLTMQTKDVRALVDDLSVAVAGAPLREGLRCLLMEALWRSGRRADAMERFREGERLLRAELGVEPGAELQALHVRMLREQPIGDSAALTQSARSRPRPAPHQLPVDVNRFTGRDDELAAVDKLVGETTGARLIGLHGPAGAGKTALAVHWAHTRKGRFPGGQLFLNLRGHGAREPLSSTEALGILLQQVGVPADALPDGADARGALFRRELENTRALLVLDNAHDSTQVRPLLPGDVVVTLVTSRTQLRSLASREGAHRVTVDAMSERDAIDFLTARFAPIFATGSGVDQDDVAELAELCGRLPVALAVAAERAGRDRHLPLGQLNGQLRQGRMLDTLAAWEDDPSSNVRAVFEWSYRWLQPSTARAFRLLGLHPHPTFDTVAAACLTGAPLGDAAGLLDRLVDAHLLTERRQGEFEMHDLVRAFAVETVFADELEEDRRAAVRRLRDGYLHSARAARAQIMAARGEVRLDQPAAGVTVQNFEGLQQAVSWFRTSYGRLDALIRDAENDADHRCVYQLVELINTFLKETGWLAEEDRLNQAARRAATAAGDEVAAALAEHRLATILLREGDTEVALKRLARARTVFEAAGEEAMIGRSLLVEGAAMINLGTFQDAVVILRRAIDVERSLGMHASAPYNNLAVALLSLGRFDEAIEAARLSIKGDEADGIIGSLPMSYDTLGEVYLAAGRFAEAHEAFLRALNTYDKAGREGWEVAVSWYHLGLAQQALGHREDAVSGWRRALQLLEQTGRPDHPELSRQTLRELIDATT